MRDEVQPEWPHQRDHVSADVAQTDRSQCLPGQADSDGHQRVSKSGATATGESVFGHHLVGKSEQQRKYANRNRARDAAWCNHGRNAFVS